MPADYDRVAANWNVIASVTVEGEWDSRDAFGEARWISELNAASGRPMAHVAQAWLDQPELPELLERLSGLSLVRSVRHKPVSNAKPGEGGGGMSQASFINGYKQLARVGFHFDLQTPWWHLGEVRHLVDQSDDTLIVLNHTGLPSDRSSYGFEGWHTAMQALSAIEQVRVKISGLGTGGPWTVAANRKIVLSTIELFGVDRCMFASNFPVDGLCASFDTIYSGYKQITRDFSANDRHALFCKTAIDTYRLSELKRH